MRALTTRTLCETAQREIKSVCDLRATAVAARNRYGQWHETLQQRVPAMMAYVVSEGRLFALKPSEWTMLLVGVALCGLATLLF
jgi:hypothetical protein